MTIRIERLERLQVQGQPDAVVINAEDDITGIRGSVEGAAGEDSGRAGMSLAIANVPREKRRQMDGDGQVEITAGYADSDEVSPNLLFVGNLVAAPTHRQGATKVTRFYADSFPNVLAHSRHALTFKPNTDEGVVLGDIIQELATRSGANIALPDSAFEFTAPKYSTKNTALVEIERLVQMLSYLTGRPHTLVPAPVPSQGSSEFTSGAAASAANTYRVVDAGNGANAVQAIQLRFPEDTVYEAGPTPVRAQPSSPITVGGETTNEDVSQQGASLEYEATIPLDPRIGVGVIVEVIDDETGEDGRLVVTEAQHDFGNWTTKFAGPFERVDVEVLLGG